MSQDKDKNILKLRFNKPKEEIQKNLSLTSKDKAVDKATLGAPKIIETSSSARNSPFKKRTFIPKRQGVPFNKNKFTPTEQNKFENKRPPFKKPPFKPSFKTPFNSEKPSFNNNKFTPTPFSPVTQEYNGFANKKSILPKKKKLKKESTKPKNTDNFNKFHENSFIGRVDVSSLHDYMDYDSKKRKIKKNETFIKKKIDITKATSIKKIALDMSMKNEIALNIAKKIGFEGDENDIIDTDILQLIIEECGHIAIRQDEITKKKTSFPEINSDINLTKERPPVISIVGHVDHGKTSLLDKIRNSSLTSEEAGGITQSIGAYQIEHNNKKITFIDTPGHEAFISMRARGVNATDIAILVVASNESLQSQTAEAITHIKKSNTPIIVVATKSDLPDANINKIKQDLLQHEIIVKEFGGEVEIIEVSAKTGHNINKLLELILETAKNMDIRADFDYEYVKGIVLESKIDPKIGTVTSILVQHGILKYGAFCLANVSSGKIKAMFNDRKKSIKEALPSTPVEIIGLDCPPCAGAEFFAGKDNKLISSILKMKQDELKIPAPKKRINSLEDLIKPEIDKINLIIKADTFGSVEALKNTLMGLNCETYEVNIILASIGNVKESDIDLATISNSLIISFNLKISSEMKKICNNKEIKTLENNIIYKITEEIERNLLSLAKPEEKEVFTGIATIKQIFTSSKFGNIAGCMVTNGEILKDSIIKVMRKEKEIANTKLTTLKRGKSDAKSVKNGFECGIVLKDFDGFKLEDELHCYKIELV